MAASDDELQKRVCRCCNETYAYPVFNSTATRFYCEECMDLPAGVRAAFERFNRRIKSLSATVARLEQKLAGSRAEPAKENPA